MASCKTSEKNGWYFRLLRLSIGRHAIWLHYTNSPRWNKKRAHFEGYPCHVATSFTSYSGVCEKFRLPVPRTIKNKLKKQLVTTKNIFFSTQSHQFPENASPVSRHSDGYTIWASPSWVPPGVPHLQEGTSWISWWILMEFGDQRLWSAFEIFKNRSSRWSASGSPQMSTVCHGKWPWIGQSSSLVLHGSP